MFEVVLFIFLGLILLGLEIFIVSFGLLTLSAIICFYWAYQLRILDEAGSSPLRLQTLGSLVVSGLAFLLYLAYGSWKVRALRRKRGPEVARVIYLETPHQGQVEWNGERWRFQSSQELCLEDHVQIERVEGLTLFVKKVISSDSAAADSLKKND